MMLESLDDIVGNRGKPIRGTRGPPDHFVNGSFEVEHGLQIIPRAESCCPWGRGQPLGDQLRPLETQTVRGVGSDLASCPSCQGVHSRGTSSAVEAKGCAGK